MIGVYTKNKFLTQNIISLFQQLGATAWKENEKYQSVILYLDPKDLNNFLKNNPSVIAICLDTDHPAAFCSLSLPVRLENLQQAVLQSLNAPTHTLKYENKTFVFDPRARQLLHKQTNTAISLTEKESDLIAFLAQQPNKSANREQILQHVWQYSENAETHTLESHIYTLRQKLNKDAASLIQYKDGIITLV